MSDNKTSQDLCSGGRNYKTCDRFMICPGCRRDPKIDLLYRQFYKREPSLEDGLDIEILRKEDCK